MSKQTTHPLPLPKQTKSTIKIVFLTLFLDLIGFSIIFPLFPSMVEHYLLTDPQNVFLNGILGAVDWFSHLVGEPKTVTPVVLFGGILGGLYSLLQFLFAPFWGSLSDRIGRKPILILSLSGLALCYLLWIFAGTFSLLIASRVIGGIMAGNISTATAVIGDITTPENRSRGMAFVGIAIGTGFIFGPALGGIMSLWRWDLAWPQLLSWGINPFSACASLAFILAVVNLVFVIFKFQESLPPEKRGQSENFRSANALALFKPLNSKEVNLTNIAHFLFLVAFSGMEFTLTFLAVERFAFSSLDNGLMFIFIGVLIAGVQGGYVRRKAHQIGEKRMALQGLFTIIPGLLIVGSATSNFTLHLGLAFLAIGAAQIIPCLTALVSLYAPSEQQGKAIGTFRSLGALARVIGPFVASIIYWKMGSASPYWMGAAFLVLPILLTVKLPQPTKVAQTTH